MTKEQIKELERIAGDGLSDKQNTMEYWLELGPQSMALALSVKIKAARRLLNEVKKVLTNK